MIYKCKFIQFSIERSCLSLCQAENYFKNSDSI